jgi:hypothetical protein
MDCVCGHFDYNIWAIQLHVKVARIQDPDKLVDQHLDCHSRGVRVSDATHTFTTFAVPRLGVFLCGFQHSVPGTSHNVPY